MSDARRRNAEMAREYLAWQRHRRNRARETMFIYTDVIQKLLLWIGDTPLAAASTTTLEDFIERPRVRRRPEHVRGQKIIGSPATRKRDVTIVRGLYKYLNERGLIGVNPAVLLTSPTVHNVQPRAIDDDLWRAVWCNLTLDDTERVALGLGFFCGLRRAEIVSLQTAHLDVARMRIVGLVRKGGDEDSLSLASAAALVEQRLPHLIGGSSDTFLNALTRLHDVRAAKPFLMAWGDALGRPDDYHLRGSRKDPYPEGWTPPNVLNKRLRSLLWRCGVPRDAFTVHSLRHSAITNWLRMGVPLHIVSRLAAHSDVTTTMRYVKVGTDPLRDFLHDETLARPGRWL
jgi:site-specific recombinase XerD